MSEVMLQQTQTDRVIPKYLAWMRSYPEPAALAAAPLDEVLRAWSGLGYNRRALALAKAASRIAAEGFPEDEEGLLELPGIGPYTARAILAFAFGRPVVFIETNVRSVFLHHFFPGEEQVPDSRIAPFVEAALDREDPRTWYYALMDYGVDIKKRFGNPNKRSAHYARQSPFADSNRRVRGSILKALNEGPLALRDIETRLPFSEERVASALSELAAEGFVAEEGGSYRLGS